MSSYDADYQISTRGSSAAVESPEPIADPPQSSKIPNQYGYSPTYPTPFVGTLEASLDAIMEFGRVHPEALQLTTTLQKRVDGQTNWPDLFGKVLVDVGHARLLLEELFFLVTRKLLPEQIAENRALLLSMYKTRKVHSTRIMLRYDMLCEWTKPHVTVTPPLAGNLGFFGPPPSPIENERFPNRPPLRPNIIPTLIVEPFDKAYRAGRLMEQMRHSKTELDKWLLVKDEEAEEWDATLLITHVTRVVLLWQSLRGSNEQLAEFEATGWEPLMGKGDECEWVRDPVGKGASSVSG